MIEIVVFTIFCMVVLAILASGVYLWVYLYHKQRGWCKPFTHRWNVTRVSVPAFDPSAKGELWRCQNCDKVRAL